MYLQATSAARCGNSCYGLLEGSLWPEVSVVERNSAYGTGNAAIRLMRGPLDTSITETKSAGEVYQHTKNNAHTYTCIHSWLYTGSLKTSQQIGHLYLASTSEAMTIRKRSSHSRKCHFLQSSSFLKVKENSSWVESKMMCEQMGVAAIM